MATYEDYPAEYRSGRSQRVGDRLPRARLQRNLTQQELADAAGVSKRTVERIEAGESNQFYSLIRLVRALDLMEQFNALRLDFPER